MRRVQRRKTARLLRSTIDRQLNPYLCPLFNQVHLLDPMMQNMCQISVLTAMSPHSAVIDELRDF